MSGATNVNKTIANKRRGIESKEKNNLKGWYDFFMASTKSKEERKEKEIKKKKSNFKSNNVESPHTCHRKSK